MIVTNDGFPQTVQIQIISLSLSLPIDNNLTEMIEIHEKIILNFKFNEFIKSFSVPKGKWIPLRRLRTTFKIDNWFIWAFIIKFEGMSEVMNFKY